MIGFMCAGNPSCHDVRGVAARLCDRCDEDQEEFTTRNVSGRECRAVYPGRRRGRGHGHGHGRINRRNRKQRPQPPSRGYCCKSNKEPGILIYD